MSFLKSPGVHVREIDLTGIVPAVPTTGTGTESNGSDDADVPTTTTATTI